MCDPNLIKQVLFLLFWCTFPIFTVLSIIVYKCLNYYADKTPAFFVFCVPWLLCFIVGMFLFTYQQTWC